MFRAVYGISSGGKQVERLSFRSGRFFFSVLTYGAVLESFGFDDVNIVLNHQSLADYENMGGFLGAVVGPYANRIKNASFMLDGKTYQLEKNEGENSLHSGTACFGKKVWEVLGVSENGCTLGLATEEGAGGFPGSHEVMVSYTLTGDGALTLDYTVSSSAKCPVSITNHAYFNLNGRKSTVTNHRLKMNAPCYLEVDGGREWRRIGKIQISQLIHSSLHAQSHYPDVHHLVHSAFPQHLDPQEFSCSLICDHLHDKVSCAGIIMGFVIHHGSHGDHIMAFCPGCFFVKTGAACIQSRKLYYSCSQDSRIRQICSCQVLCSDPSLDIRRRSHR